MEVINRRKDKGNIKCEWVIPRKWNKPTSGSKHNHVNRLQRDTDNIKLPAVLFAIIEHC